MIKRIIYYLFSISFIFFSSCLMPMLFNTAFNFLKGKALNQDGIMFIPVGFFLIILSIVIDVLLVRKAFKMNKTNQRIIIILVVLIAILTLSIIISFSAWESFFDCLFYFKGLNTKPQIPMMQIVI